MRISPGRGNSSGSSGGFLPSSSRRCTTSATLASRFGPRENAALSQRQARRPRARRREVRPRGCPLGGSGGPGRRGKGVRQPNCATPAARASRFGSRSTSRCRPRWSGCWRAHAADERQGRECDPDGCRDGRGRLAREPARFRPQRAPDRRAERRPQPAFQPCRAGRLRAWLDLQDIHRRPGARGGARHPLDDHGTPRGR